MSRYEDTHQREFARIWRRLNRLERWFGEMANDLSVLTSAVEDEVTVVDSVLVLVDDLAAQIEAAKNDPVAIQALVDKLNAERDKVSAAVVKNTPAQPAP